MSLKSRVVAISLVCAATLAPWVVATSAEIPTLSTSSPPALATKVPVDTQVSARFNVGMDAGTLTSETVTLSPFVGIKSLAAGYAYTVALKNDGTVDAWGDNASGQIMAPVGLAGVVAVAAGEAHTLALKSDGVVVAWGRSDYGQTVVPAGVIKVKAIAAGFGHSVALLENGTVVAWGLNSSGQCTVPAGLSGVAAIAAGGYHTLALKDDGTVVAWGRNDHEQCVVPVGLSGVIAVAAGWQHSVALKADGALVLWGDGHDGQLVAPQGLVGVMAIAAGGNHTLAMKDDGTVVAWGYGRFGQTAVPAELGAVRAIAAGCTHSLVLKGDDTVVAWGRNQRLQTTVKADAYHSAHLVGLVAYDAGSRSVSLVPDLPLPYATSFIATISRSVTSLDGLHPVADLVWIFNSAPELDSDGDGIVDRLDPDDDNDGVSDLDEALHGTDPLNPDTMPPLLTLSALPDRSYTRLSGVNVSGVARDNSGIVSVTVNGTGVSCAADGTFSAFVPLLVGDNGIRVTAIDPAGNRVSREWLVVSDQAAPGIAFTAPPDNLKTRLTSIPLSGTLDESAQLLVTDEFGATSSPLRVGLTFALDVALKAGLNTITVDAEDLAGNRATAKRTIFQDSFAPTLAVTSPEADSINRSGEVLLCGSVEDASAVASLTVDCAGESYRPQLGDDNIFCQQLTFPAEGAYAITVTATDELGNQSQVIRNLLYTMGVISLNSGAEFTKTRTVTAAVDYYPFATKARFRSNNSNWSRWESFVPRKTLVLSGADGIKTVSVQFIDGAGQPSEIYSDTIILDSQGPIGSILIEQGARATATSLFALTLAASDTSGTVEMQFNENGTGWSPWVGYATSWTFQLAGTAADDGTKTIYVRFRDRAGNLSRIFSDAIVLDRKAPVGRVVINRGAAVTRNRQVLLTVSADQTTNRLQVKNGDEAWGPWESFAGKRMLTLSAGSGVKTVQVRFRDFAGNTSAETSDSILLK